MPSIKAFNDGGFSAKILALTDYDMQVLTRVHTKKNKDLIEEGAAKLLLTYFENYVDARARANPYRLHHIYEFDLTGDKASRLFKRNITKSPAGVIMSFSFKPAKNPNREGYMFASKAIVMEEGKPLTIKPRRSKYLMYRLRDGRFVKTSKPSFVEHPGGIEVKGAFAQEFKEFTSVQAKRILTEFRFFEKINDNIRLKRSGIIPKINSQKITGLVNQAKIDADRIALEANRTNAE